MGATVSGIMFAMHTYIVHEAAQITPSTLLLTLEAQASGVGLAFEPGQYAVINFRKQHRPSAVRCFSIVSSPTEQGRLQFAMRTRGHYTKALARLKPGDIVTVRGPYGGFIFNTHRDHQTVWLAGGIGITPFISMARYATATDVANQIDLVYSCQSQDDVPFGEELRSLEKANPNLRVTFVIGDGPVDKLHGARVEKGRISPEMLQRIPAVAAAETTFLICGPPPFMKAVNSTLRSQGVPARYIMTEAFSQGPNRQTGKVKNWPLNMYFLTAAGLAVTTFVITVADLLKTLPSKDVATNASNVSADKLTNSRQTDLDALVNQLPTQESTGGSSEALAQAQAEADAQSKTVKATTSTSSGSTTTTTTTTTTKPTPTVTQTTPPVTTKPPVCTTSQSGVRTCR